MGQILLCKQYRFFKKGSLNHRALLFDGRVFNTFCIPVVFNCGPPLTDIYLPDAMSTYFTLCLVLL